MRLPLFLALKYLKPKRSVASAITVVSVLGVMLGVAAVLVVRSVMTGFGEIWEEKILDFKPHVTLLPTHGNVIGGEDALAARIRRVPGVVCVTPEIDTRVLVSCRGRVLAPVIIGVDGDDFASAYRVGEPRAGSFDLEGDTLLIGATAARPIRNASLLSAALFFATWFAGLALLPHLLPADTLAAAATAPLSAPVCPIPADPLAAPATAPLSTPVDVPADSTLPPSLLLHLLLAAYFVHLAARTVYQTAAKKPWGITR